MSIKKTAAIATAVGALAAVSVPAMAFDNEFHGMYRLRAMMSNFENAGGGVLAKDAPTLNVFEQRARIQYTAKASDDLKLFTQFEVDSSWGDTAYNNGRGMGGAMGADVVNLETKHIYLDFNCPLTGANVKVGIQPQIDSYKGILFNDDVAGIFATKKIGAITANLAYSRLQDYNRSANPTAASATPLTSANYTNPETANPIGRANLDLYLLDGKLALSKDLTVGGSYYFIRKDQTYTGQDVHTLGVNAAGKFGIINADAFVGYQFGDALDGTSIAKLDLTAYALQLAAKVNLGPAGTIRGNFLYTSGDDNAADKKSKAWQSLNSADTNAVSSNTYYEPGMLLLMRSKWAMDSDKAVINTSNNNNRGVTLFAAGYDATISDKLSASANIGYGLASEKRGANSTSIGTELNASVNYKMFSNLTATLQAAYVILGDGMNKKSGVLMTGGAANADDPYLAEIMFNYTF
jgi:hypothetical protein